MSWLPPAYGGSLVHDDAMSLRPLELPVGRSKLAWAWPGNSHMVGLRSRPHSLPSGTLLALTKWANCIKRKLTHPPSSPVPRQCDPRPSAGPSSCWRLPRTNKTCQLWLVGCCCLLCSIVCCRSLLSILRKLAAQQLLMQAHCILTQGHTLAASPSLPSCTAAPPLPAHSPPKHRLSTPNARCAHSLPLPSMQRPTRCS